MPALVRRGNRTKKVTPKTAGRCGGGRARRRGAHRRHREHRVLQAVPQVPRPKVLEEAGDAGLYAHRVERPRHLPTALLQCRPGRGAVRGRGGRGGGYGGCVAKAWRHYA
eukprot:ctg_2124.g544